MSKQFNDVKEWAKLFNLPNPDKFHIPSDKKLLKNINYSPAHMEPIVKKYDGTQN